MFTYAENIKSVIVSSMPSKFAIDPVTLESNVGVGYTGYNKALAYSRLNNLDYFCAIFLFGGEPSSPSPFNATIWTWNYIVRIYRRTDAMAESSSMDEDMMNLAGDFIGMMNNPVNRQAIVTSGAARIVSVNDMLEITMINDISYLINSMVIGVKEQIVT